MRRLGLVGAWLVTTVLSVALANTSIQLVGGSVTDSPSLAVTALEPEAQPVTTVTDGPSVSVVAAGEEPVPPGTAPNPSSTAGSTPPSSPADTTPATTSTTTTTTTTTMAVSSDSQPRRTGPFLFPTSGGRVTVRCVGDEARLTGAVPRAGYSVDIDNDTDGVVKVTFTSQTSAIHVEIICVESVAQRVDDSADSTP